jgi:hypothetical protein
MEILNSYQNFRLGVELFPAVDSSLGSQKEFISFVIE